MKKILVFITFIMITLVMISTIISLREQFLKIKVSNLHDELYQNHEILQGLKAEWYYLNNTQHLERLANKYLPDLVKPIKQFDPSLLKNRDN